LKGLMKFSTKQAWVKHDEHYHVDFELPCEPLEVQQGAPADRPRLASLGSSGG